MSNIKPKVSVCVVTYNQEKYISQCLQSIVDQVTNFYFDVIVADDCSTDGTREILQEFERRYPGLIKLILNDTNKGPYKNFSFVHQQAAGEYIAHVDGDDYCLPGKLQQQANLLDSDPNCNIVWHRVLVENAQGATIDGALQGIPNLGEMKFDRGAIIQYIAIGANSSKMYRKSVREFDLPDFEVVDYFANVQQIGNGVARFVGSQHYGVYRSGIGISSSGIKTRQILARCFVYFYNKYPEYRLHTNTAVLTYCVVDFKHRRKTCWLFFLIWLKTFHIHSITNLLTNVKFIKQLRLSA